MKKLLSPLLAASGILFLKAETNIEDATVTLPYRELASLVERVNDLERASEERPPKPPLLAVVHSARYTLEFEDSDQSILYSKFEVSNLSEEWQWIPLLPAGRAIRSIEPATAIIAESEGMLRLLLEPEANVTIELSFPNEQSIRSRGGRVVATFHALPAAQNSLEIRKDALDATIAVSGAIATGNDGSEYGLPSSGGPVQVKLLEKSTLAKAKWNGSIQYLITDSGGSIRVRGKLQLNAMDNGSTSEAILTLPALSRLENLQSPGLDQRYSTDITAEGLVVRMRWEDDERTARSIDVEFVAPLETADDVWKIEAVKVSNAERWAQSVYIAPFDGVNLSPIDGDWINQNQIPEWIASLVGGSELHYLRQDAVSEIVLNASLLPRVQTSDATIPVASYTTQLVAEGGMLHQASITVKHETATPYPFTLPEGAKLLACSVDKRNAEPVLQNDGSLLLSLPKPQKGSANTQLSYTYTTRGDAFDPVEGKADLELPLTPLFIHRVNWLVTLPQEFQAVALEGNVVIEEGGSRAGPVRLAKQICHEEAPYASLYYTRRDLDH